FADRHSPALGGHRLQHHAGGGAALAHGLQEVADAARPVGILVAVLYLGARTMRQRAQSASISSATIIGRLVRGPGPISDRCATIVTSPDGLIDTKTCGSLTVPCGMRLAP